MIAVFQTHKHQVAYVDLRFVMAVIGYDLITVANAWSVTICEADRDRILDEFRKFHGME